MDAPRASPSAAFGGSIENQIESLRRLHMSLPGKGNKRARQKINEKIARLREIAMGGPDGASSAHGMDDDDDVHSMQDTASETGSTPTGSPAPSPSGGKRAIGSGSSADAPAAPPRLAALAPPRAPSSPPTLWTSRSAGRRGGEAPGPFTFGLSVDVDSMFQ